MADGDRHRSSAAWRWRSTGTTEGPHFDRPAFKVARIYVTLAADGRTANFKFTPDEQQFKCLMAPDAFAPIPNAWGRQGWTTATLSKLSAVELKNALEDGVGARAEEAQAAMITKGTAWSCAERALRNIGRWVGCLTAL